MASHQTELPLPLGKRRAGARRFAPFGRQLASLPSSASFPGRKRTPATRGRFEFPRAVRTVSRAFADMSAQIRTRPLPRRPALDLDPARSRFCRLGRGDGQDTIPLFGSDFLLVHRTHQCRSAPLEPGRGNNGATSGGRGPQRGNTTTGRLLARRTFSAVEPNRSFSMGPCWPTFPITIASARNSCAF